MSEAEILKKLEEAFSPYIKYGILKNDNKKYLSQGYNSLIVAIFPYFKKDGTSLFPKYCSIPDYHVVVKNLFEEKIKNIFSEYKVMVDISPFKEKKLAQDAGLGEIGENNLLLTKEYGSYVFIGEALVKEELSELKHSLKEVCIHCKKCIQACPGDALKDGFDKQKCLSYLTQKNKLNEEEEKQLKKSVYLIGCDVCQSVCPININIPETKINDFNVPPLELDINKLFSMDEESYKEKYDNYAFCYKGLEILKRNARIINEQ